MLLTVFSSSNSLACAPQFFMSMVMSLVQAFHSTPLGDNHKRVLADRLPFNVSPPPCLIHYGHVSRIKL